MSVSRSSAPCAAYKVVKLSQQLTTAMVVALALQLVVAQGRADDLPDHVYHCQKAGYNRAHQNQYVDDLIAIP